MKQTIERVRARYVAAVVLALWGGTGCSPGVGAQQDAFVPLIRSIAERVATADQVALNKWDSGQPVYAQHREAQVLANVAAMATSYGLTVEDVTNVFTDQIEANKEVQYALLNYWRRQRSAPTTPRQSLSGVIRPELDRLQGSILQNLQDVAPWRSMTACPTQIADVVAQVAQEKSFDTLHLVALDRAAARVCVKS